jgi:tetratricopeptide (TPR) repeat protein
MMAEDPSSTQQASGSFIAQAREGSTATITVTNIYQTLPSHPIDATLLAVAQRQFAALPLDTIPAVAPLPAGSRMLFLPNPLFVGRKEALRGLAAVLKGDREGAEGEIQTAAIATGIGGLGKTQLVSEFVHRYGQYFAGGVFWLSFASAIDVQAEIAACRTALRQELPLNVGSLPLEDQVRLVLAAWQSPLPRLLVFDNCEEEQLLAQWRPRTGGCRVLVTSRRLKWTAELGVKPRILDVLSREESLLLLHQHRPDLPASELDAIAQVLGDLPLALHLAGSFLAKYRQTRLGRPSDYLTHLRRMPLLQHPSLQGQGSARYSATSHVQHVAQTFAVSYEQLKTDDPMDEMALALLARAAYFAPGEPIPYDLLVHTLEHTDEDDLLQELQQADALERLVSLGLVEPQGERSLRLHRLVADFVRMRMETTGSGAQAAVEQVLLETADRLNQEGYPAPILALQPHLRAVTTLAQQRTDERVANLCAALAAYLQMIGLYNEAQSYAERALTITEQVLGPQHPSTATSLNNLAELYRNQGRYEEAEPLYQRALTIREQVLGPQHPDTAGSLHNLALLYQDQGRYEEAEPLYQRALTIREQVLGPQHPSTEIARENYAIFLEETKELG